MADDKNLRKQRDRFLAFSFASSDLFIEVSEDETITYMLGAAKGLTGADDNSIVGTRWLDIFDRIDRPTLIAMHSKAKPAQRCGPILVKIDPQFGKEQKAILTAIKMPESEKFYITLGFTSVLMARTGEIQKVTEDKELLDTATFLHAAQEAMNLAKNLDQDLDLTLIDFSDVEEFKGRVGKDGWNSFFSTVGGLLKSRSVDGMSATEISEGKYGILHDKELNPDVIHEQISEIAKQTDPQGKDIHLQKKTITSDISEISERDATKALVYTINEFERKGTELTIENLNTGFKSYIDANAQKIAQFKDMIRQLSFNLYFQPIVNIDGEYDSHHFELLSRFQDGGSTMEWIMFGEDIGLAPEFDLAVLERVINYVKYKSSGRSSRFAVNISGQSIQNEQFFEKMMEKLNSTPNLNKRLLFEITESSHIAELDKVGSYLKKLKDEGYETCLDDFGAGSASFQYLQALHVEYVKIDGQYVKRLLTSDRDEAMIKSLISMCKNLDIKVVAEMVENKEQLQKLRDMGADYAQGYLFAKPGPKPEYTPPKKL